MIENEEKTERTEKVAEQKGRGFLAFVGELHIAVKIIYAVFFVCLLLFAAYVISEPFADFFNRRIGSVLRAALAYATGLIPFSLAEYILILLPLIIFVAVRWASKRYADSWRSVLIFSVSLLSVLALFFSVFAVGFGAGYHTSTLDKKLGLERVTPSADELYDTARIVASLVNEEARRVEFIDKGSSIMPYGYGEMNDKLIDAFDKACEKYEFIQKLHSRLKPVMLSEAMSYTHITGVYSFFTGEANINVAFPDYTVPFTAAHELAHQRGIAREDEANFVAYLVCLESDDAYIRYSGYMNLYEYLLSSLARADSTLYTKAYVSVCIEAKYEMKAYGEFFKKYSDSFISEISGAVNDTYLTMQGTAGSESYGMVVDLAVAYYKTKR